MYQKQRSLSLPIAAVLLSHVVLGQIGVVSPLAHPCGPSNGIVCITSYASVMPYHFHRDIDRATNSHPFGSTSVPNDTSFSLVAPADFLVFDKRGLEILGPKPSYEYVFQVSDSVHEAPVYVPAQNKLYMSHLAPPSGYLPQLVVDLNQFPPTLSEYLSDPPVYAPNGGTFHKGLIYWGASGGNNSIDGREYRVGIQTVDPATNKSTVLLNSFFGFYFNTIDDLFVHPNGDIWFTDPVYSWPEHLTDTPAQIPPATYRFRPSTGSVQLVEDSLVQPNGIALSPDQRTVYISDTGSLDAPLAQTAATQPLPKFNATGRRTIYAYDLSSDATHLLNKRPIYFAQDWIPDGLKVAENGYIVTGAGAGVDVLDPTGQLLLRVQTNYTVQNFAWTGTDLKTLWVMGQGGISKIEWDLKGQDLRA